MKYKPILSLPCVQDIQNQRAAQGSKDPQLAVVPLVKGLALMQLGDRQRAAGEVAAARQLLDSSKQQTAAAEQGDSLQRVLQMYGRVSALVQAS